jgi:TRAP-type C4-dicarboxylate transport system substrate-binding protein
MNKDSYAKLPQKGREAIDRASAETLSRAMGITSDRSGAFMRKQTGDKPGQTLTQIDAAEMARFKAVLAPLTEQWVKATPDGQKVLDAFRAEVAKIKAGS